MIVEERRLKIPGLMERVPVACEFVVDAARHAGLDERAVHHCQLAVDEACTNVVEHGYRETGEVQSIDIICRNEGDRFSITVSDDSPAFDPLNKADPDPHATLENRTPGGWGIYFIKKVMDEVIYQYEASRNSLKMVKLLHNNTRIDDKQPRTKLISVTSPARHLWSVAPHGRLDSDLCPSIEDVVNNQLDSGHRYLIMDLTDVDYVSSSGLKTLVGLWQRARELKGDLVLAGLNNRVSEVMEIIGLDLVFGVYVTLQDAVNGLTAKLQDA
jgi:anti-anti-sigma factor